MTRALVRKVDHVFVPVADPAPLFELFTRDLGLPVAWEDHNYRLFQSAAVCVGNANIEFVRGDASLMPFFAPTEPLTVRGIAFEPAAASTTVVAELDERGLPHAPPFQFNEPGTGEALWTNVFLQEMVGDTAMIFFCDYHADVSLRGDAARKALHECGGGRLGVRRVAEITIGVTELDASMDRWNRLLAPVAADAHGAFALGDGPAIRLRRSPIEGVAGIFLEVSSVENARRALRELDLLGPARASGVGLDYARTGGLDVWLTEPRSG